MRGVVVVLLAVTACRPKPPESLNREPEIDQPAEPVSELSMPTEIVLAPRPDIDLSTLIPDPTHELRWPLSIASHPELEPQFEIAAALAEPGVGWIDLCRLGAQNRHLGRDKRDLVTYLRGWCSVGKQDLDGALTHLRPLTTSVASGIAPAVRADFANILVSSGDANDASRLLTKHGIKDITVLDTLAASYVEIGKLDDAYEINELAITVDNRRNVEARCHRLARRIVLRPPPKQIKAIDLPNAGLFDVRGHETCERLEHELECWLEPAAGCDAYFKDQKLDVDRAKAFAKAYFGWPTTPNSEMTWWRVARNAHAAIPHPGADVLAVTALENGLRTTPCNSTYIKAMVDLANEIRIADHSPAINDALTRVISTKLCIAP